MLTVAIVGKPNVGKSALFNRIIQKPKAIVAATPGITRDRNIATGQWLNQTFRIIDTGGLQTQTFSFKTEIQAQVQIAIESAQVILFLVSYLEGIDADDFYVWRLLKKQKKTKILFVVNKSEKKNLYADLTPFYQFGFATVFFISVVHGIGIGNLLDAIVQTKTPSVATASSFKFCVIGKPNVGKSSLVNTILQQNRLIVSSIPNTTRDAIDSDFSYYKKRYTIIDTAGIKKKSRLKVDVDKYAYHRVEQTISRSQLVLVVLDGTQPLSAIDKTIAGLAHKANLPTILVVNKWDLVLKDSQTTVMFTKKIKQFFKFLTYAPVVFLSAKYNQKISNLFVNIAAIQKNLTKQFSTQLLTHLTMKLQMLNTPPLFNGGWLKINLVQQIKSQIPSFIMFCNNPKFLHFSYARFLENAFRHHLALNNVPLTLYFKAKGY